MHCEPDRELMVCAAFCRTNGAWFRQDHWLRSVGQAFLVHVVICFLEGHHRLWDVSSSKGSFKTLGHRGIATGMLGWHGA
jgi:hypothetical protein